jgi:hypothetical protein
MGLHITQMFPSKYLAAEDLRALNPGMTVVTIEKVDYKTGFSREVGQANIEYFLKLIEFKKWMRLNKFNGMLLADLFGGNTDDWVGKCIQIFPIQIPIAGKHIWVINIAIDPPRTRPILPRDHDISGLAAQAHNPGVQAPGLPPASTVPAAAGQEGRLGIDTAAAIFGALIERNRTWDNFVAYMKDVNQGALVLNLEPPECSYAVREWAMKFCKLAPRVNAKPSDATLDSIKARWKPPAPAVGDVVNHKTGELLKSGAEALPAGAVSAPAEIDEEDIPF